MWSSILRDSRRDYGDDAEQSWLRLVAYSLVHVFHFVADRLGEKTPVPVIRLVNNIAMQVPTNVLLVVSFVVVVEVGISEFAPVAVAKMVRVGRSYDRSLHQLRAARDNLHSS